MAISTRSGKRTLLLMVLVFIAPIAIGTVMFFNADKLKISSATVNYGKLITPPVLIGIDGLNIDDKAADLETTFRKKWTLLYLAPDNCDDKCTARIDLLKRLRLLTNENMRRIRTVALFPGTLKHQQKLAFDNPDLVISTKGENAANFLNQFPSREENPVYLIDPSGNLMMYYAGDMPDIKRMLKDLKRILKYSHIG